VSELKEKTMGALWNELADMAQKAMDEEDANTLAALSTALLLTLKAFDADVVERAIGAAMIAFDEIVVEVQTDN